MPSSSVGAPTAPAAPRAVQRPMPLHAMPGHLFRRLHQQSVALFGAHCADADLTPVQFAALHAIDAWPHSDQSTIGRAIACDKATIGPVLERLQSKGLIVRVADEADRRAWRLRATPQGRALLGRIGPRIDAIQRELLAPLSDDESRTLLGLLARLAGQPAAARESS